MPCDIGSIVASLEGLATILTTCPSDLSRQITVCSPTLMWSSPSLVPTQASAAVK